MADRRLHRTMKTPKCIGQVRAYVDYHKGRSVTVEEIASKYGLKEGDVSQCFHILNLEGVMSRGENPWRHRSWGWRGWRRTTYHVYHPEMEELCQRCKVDKIYNDWGLCKDCFEEAYAESDPVYTQLSNKWW